MSDWCLNKQKRFDRLFDALEDVLDGMTPRELHTYTGLAEERCEEIFTIYIAIYQEKIYGKMNHGKTLGDQPMGEP